MLKRIKIVTSLLLVLAVFGLLQLTSGGLFFNALKNDKENFTVLQTIRQQQSTLNGSWVALLQTRNTLNRAGIRYMMDQNNIGSGSTVAELMQSASISLKQAEKNWADYEALPRDPRQSTAAAAEIKRLLKQVQTHTPHGLHLDCHAHKPLRHLPYKYDHVNQKHGSHVN